ncbi:DUF1998 domain-containing protein [Chloroflexus sp.]|uniref:DUF1998 domain-containing protein n=1 Tax=Chloroflexus sp. TaxID=1904827 RepID=UPI002ACDDA7B|nr:DUF1998 domain-containing protein [Chloroflexus sp.]
MQTAADALALAASYHLDVDPVELSAGYRFLPEDVQVDLFLVDTASGGAGFATEAGRQIDQILQATLRLVAECPRQCEPSCTACLRHYGNRIRHAQLDRRLAAQLLRYLIDDQLPAIPPTNLQTKLLEPLKRWFELEGSMVSHSSRAPLTVERNHRTITIGVYHALLDPLSPLFHHPLQRYGKLVSDYLVSRDLPAACQQII